MKQLKRIRFGVAGIAVLLSAGASAVNILTGGDFESKDVPTMVRLSDSAWMGKLDIGEENLTWNHYLRLKLVKFHAYESGRKRLNLSVDFGGTAEEPGFPVRPESRYRFSFEARGDVSGAGTWVRVWDKEGKSSLEKTSLGSVSVGKEWTQYKGTFSVPANAVRAALSFKLWSDNEKWPTMKFPYKEGDELLVDNVIVEPVSSGREIWPARAIVLPDDGKATAGGFSAFSSAPSAAKVPSRLVVSANDECIRFGFEFSGAPLKRGAVWKGDTVELFVSPADAKADPLQFVVSVDGDRWMSGDNPDLSTWSSSVQALNETTWRSAVDIPWKTLGYSGRPPKGTAIRFNAARNTKSLPNKDSISVFSFAGLELRNRDRFGVLYVGKPEGFSGDASAFWRQQMERKEKERLEKLNRESCLVAQLPVDFDPTIPFLPDELMEPSGVISFRGAINEHVQVPVAIANMTDAFEEYRVQLVRGYEDSTSDFCVLAPGLKSESGRTIDRNRMTLRRGVRFRDADTPARGARYDILSPLCGADTLPIPPKEAGLLCIDIDCTGLEPGHYKGELIVTPLVSGQFRRVRFEKNASTAGSCPIVEDDSKRIAVEFEVLPFAIDLGDFGFCGFSMPYKKGEIDVLNRLGGGCLLLSPWRFACKFDAEGNLLKDESVKSLEAELKLYREQARRFGRTPRVMAGYGTYETFRRVQKKNGNLAVGSGAYWKAYANYCRHFSDLIVKAGFPYDDWIAQVIDEPDTKRFTREEVVNAFRICHEAVPQMRLALTNGELEFFEDINQYVYLWIFKFFCYSDHPHVQEYARRMIDKGGAVSMYACFLSPRQDPYRYYRLLSWKASAWGSDFVSLYHFMDAPCEASFRRVTDGGIVYNTYDGLVPSVRFLSMEAGLNDMRYLKCLEKLAAKSSDAALVGEAKSFIALSYKDVTRTFQHDSMRAEKFREGCIRLIGRFLQGK